MTKLNNFTSGQKLLPESTMDPQIGIGIGIDSNQLDSGRFANENEPLKASTTSLPVRIDP